MATIIICEGDSITAGSGSTGVDGPYPAQLAILTGHNVVNIGASGDRIEYNADAADILAELEVATEETKIVVIGLGINDLYEDRRTASQIKTDLASCVSAIRAAYPDVKILGNTITRSTNTADQAADRTDVNGWIKTSGTYDAVADLELDSRLIDPTNLTYFFVDEIHLNNAGYGVIAELVAAAIASIFAPPAPTTTKRTRAHVARILAASFCAVFLATLARGAECQVKWNPQPDATGWRIWRGIELLATTTTPNATLELPAGELSTLTVTAFNALGESDHSDPMTVLPVTPESSVNLREWTPQKPFFIEATPSAFFRFKYPARSP